MKVKSADAVAQKWADRAGVAGGDYTNGINNPKQDQAEAAAAAAPAWAQGVQGAIARDGFAKGVQKAGSAKWKRKSATVGAQRFTQGVAAAKPDMAAGIGPVLQVLSGLTLPPRMPKGSPGNINRVTAVTEALRAMKVGG